MFSLERLRIAAVSFALCMIVAELWRSWGIDRPIVFVADDVGVGIVLAISAVVALEDTTRRRAFFAAAWGMNAGMLYSSFFAKLFDPEAAVAGNLDIGVLTMMIGCAFVVAVIGTLAAILLPRE